jgi:hydroxyacylglutathione hydrolase
VNYARWCEARRKDALPTLPSSIDRERRVNPFLRCDETAVAQAARSHGAASDEPVAVLTALRQWKNDFR